MKAKRGRLSSFELLPQEAMHIVSAANTALSARDQTQKDIYAEFVQSCEDLMAESRGELEFDIPSFSSFNRKATRQARFTMKMDMMRDITANMADRLDGKTSDDLTLVAVEAIKTLVMEILVDGEDTSALEAMQLANAVYKANQAQRVSGDDAKKRNDKFDAEATKAIDKAGAEAGLSKEVLSTLKEEFLGVRKKVEAEAE